MMFCRFAPAFYALPPESNPATDKVLYREGTSEITSEMLAEANLCKDHCLPFEAYDKKWRITWASKDETDLVAIEGVEWPD
ncbi:hypothetical protein OIU34_02305 [Pararhizobium sp. BT-229]|uniref:hypothetical protein n=1 Tax=Pararhizobium sp. BT-229 TaxID=2986923 RepID=UPI0021F6BE2E|nr:hypothetical protein [Pararhizobium sp. BT-229]MCV9960719.1 hypothetical protein [Pararhizobium sp. BT-229]